MTSAPLILAGATAVDITPAGPMFLFGYPHVPRCSTGVHDPLQCAALFLGSGSRGDGVLFLAHDLIFLARAFVRELRRRIHTACGVAEEAILISATHTHSGPVMADQLGNAADPVVPRADPRYLAWLADRILNAAVAAVRQAEPAELGVGWGRAEGVGSNRHDPAGPADPEVPVLLVRSLARGTPLACMLVYAMHPTVLHEDSTLISADFPHFTRQWLRAHGLPAACPVLFHQGASGDQSPRHTAQANTFAEAQRLGENLGRAVAAVFPQIEFSSRAPIRSARSTVKLEPRHFPSVADAGRMVEAARARFERLRAGGASRPAVRTAECDVFGAEETAELARAAADGRLAAVVEGCQPAEIQLIQVGPWNFVGWPGEVFVEHGLELKARAPGTVLITLANGELQGYIATEEAARQGFYEAQNAVFAVANGRRLVDATVALLRANPAPSP